MKYWKKIAVAIAASSSVLSAQDWQQKANYKIEVELDVKNHRFTGQQEIQYYNNSPDTLNEAFFHLYFNAFQPGSMMDQRSLSIEDPDKRVGERISKLDEDEIGYHRIQTLTQNQQPCQWEVYGTVLKVQLPQPVLPGANTTFALGYESQVPVQIRRSGRDNAEGIDYTMTQWYPKMAAYDEDGWHPDPYVAREFYAPFANFEVAITVDDDQRLAATGLLENFGDYWELQDSTDRWREYRYRESGEKKRTWRFKAQKVHDFAWAADEDYRHLMNKGPNGLKLHYFFKDKYSEAWEDLPYYTQAFFQEMNERFGVYPWPQFSVIQGGDGGMEYPMCTMLKGTGELKGLIGVMAHEAAHSWFYGVLASNESQYPWMDEGFTSFAESEVVAVIRDSTKANPHQRAYQIHNYIATSGQMEPLSTPADYYQRNLHYGVNAYSRGEVFLAQLKYMVGENTFRRIMLRYFDAWAFRHPDPWDFIRVAEQESGLQLDWYLNFWANTTKVIDYGIRRVAAPAKGKTEITLEKLGEMPMPIKMTVLDRSGEHHHFYIPVLSTFGAPEEFNAQEPWPWTQEEYRLEIDLDFEQIDRIWLDRKGMMADVDRSNNEYPREENQ